MCKQYDIDPLVGNYKSTLLFMFKEKIDGLVQERRNSIG